MENKDTNNLGTQTRRRMKKLIKKNSKNTKIKNTNKIKG